MELVSKEPEVGDLVRRDPPALERSEDRQHLRRVIEEDVPRLTWEWH